MWIFSAEVAADVECVEIPFAASFMTFMPSDRDGPTSVLPTRYFQLGVSPVTQGQWRQVTGTEP